MRGMAFVLAILVSVFSAAGARAEKTALVTVVTPAVKGYVLSIDLPKAGTAEKWTHSIDVHGGGVSISFESRSLGGRLGLDVLKKPMIFEDFVGHGKGPYGYRKGIFYGTRIYETGFNNALGRKTFFYLSSNVMISVGGKKIKATKPNHKTYVALFDRRASVKMEIYVGKYKVPPYALTESLPLFERITRTVKLTRVAKLDAELISHAFSTRRVQLSERRRFWLNVQPTLILPPGWSASEPIFKQAVKGVQRGRLIVEIRRYKDPDGPSILLVLEGMPLRKPLENADYFATADRLIGKLMAKHGPGKTLKIAAPAKSFCITQFKNRDRRGTGEKALVRRYSGEDDKGRKVGALVYTMGGFTVACNLIFIAQTKDFDKALEKARPDIEAIFKSIELHTYTSVFR